VFRFLSVKSIVIAPARTGRDKRSKTAVIKTDQQNNGSRCKVPPRNFMFNIVVIKFIAPAIEEIPAKCRLNIARSTEPPE
jgi:hypothetical protein